MFDNELRGTSFLRNITTILTDCTASLTTRYSLHSSHKNVKCNWSLTVKWGNFSSHWTRSKSINVHDTGSVKREQFFLSILLKLLWVLPLCSVSCLNRARTTLRLLPSLGNTKKSQWRTSRDSRKVVPADKCETPFKISFLFFLFSSIGKFALVNFVPKDLSDLAVMCTIICAAISLMKNDVFWDFTPCVSCKNRRLGGT
jgi:hypothetical protein